MRTIVRVLPRLVLLGVAGGALLVLAERAQEAHAQASDPPAAPASPSVPSADLPPVTTPPPTTPPAPAPPPVPEAPAPPPTVPPAVPVPTPTAPTTPAIPGVTAVPEVPAPGPAPVPSAPDIPGVPAAPGIPGIDTGRVVGPLPNVPDVPDVPEVPEVSTPATELPELPELPDPAIPPDGVLGLSAAPAPATPVPADALDRAPSVPVAGTAPSRVEFAETGEPLAGIDVGFPPARGPPTEAPGSPHPCPGGGSPHLTRADPAAYLSPGVDRASRRTGLLADARVYASTLLRDPLLRPD